jgi:plastocyanin
VLALSSTAMAAGGVQKRTYKIGPFKLIPGQNEIQNNVITNKPKVDGYITRIRPDLTYVNGKIPGVDVIHLHHGVWLNLGASDATWPGLPERFFAAGEEKTHMRLPKGYGYPHKRTDRWILNHMIHNLTPVPTSVYMVYEIEFVPKTAPAARGMKPVRAIWSDVMNRSMYPVFDVKKGAGKRGRYIFPDHARNPYGKSSGRRREQGRRNEWVVDRNGVLVATAGHLHPGGLHNDLWLSRKGARIRKASCASSASLKARKRCLAKAPLGKGNKAHLFRSDARYYEPAGAVSWDVTMGATRADWRVKVRKGDVLSTSATYNTKRAAWWESMGIMVTYMADDGPGKNPFKERVAHRGTITHGHLPENDNHGGEKSRLPDPRKLGDGPVNPPLVDVLGFNYRLGDLNLRSRPPVVTQGNSLTFRNSDADRRIYHSITSCKAPCNRATGIAYPLADGPVQFESGTLGDDGPPTVGRVEWKTPAKLKKGTYTYFCRIHPFMRGAFRVKG